MKYVSKRNYLYPVLRPYSDDYEDAELKTEVTAGIDGAYINIAVDFHLNEESIRREVEAGNARCAAMLYCSDISHREMLVAEKGRFRLSKSVHSRMLVGRVELNPLIVTSDNISHSTHTAHREYGNTPVAVGRFQPLATDRPWHFDVNAEQRATKSIFNLATDTDNILSDSEFDVEINVNERYLTIKANEGTLDLFRRIRSNEKLTIPTVYMNALIDALAYIKYNNLEDENDGYDSNGWVACIKTNLNRLGIKIGNMDEAGSHSIFRAAQLLLEKPFWAIIRNDWLDANDEDTG